MTSAPMIPALPTPPTTLPAVPAEVDPPELLELGAVCCAGVVATVIELVEVA